MNALPAYPEHTTLWTSFHRRALLAADRPALSFRGKTWSYSAMDASIEGLASALHGLGVAKGDRVGFLAFNCPECLFTLLASARLGAIFVPLNFRLTSTELQFLISDAQIHTLIVGPDHFKLIEPLRSGLSCRNFVLMADTGAIGWQTLGSILASALPPAPPCEVLPDDISTLIYTSGTTGVPKGAMLTHANLWANNLNWILSFGITEQDSVLTSAPMFHVSGLFVLLSAVLLVGGHVVLYPSFEAGAVLSAVQAYSITLTFSVPTMMLALSQHPSFESTDLSSLRLVVVGGAPSPESLLRLYAERNIPVSHTYGSTECITACTFLETASAMKKLNSAGRSMPLVEVRVINGEGEVITKPGERGEVCARGKTVITGYWKRPEATAASRTKDGWLRTGDIGYFDAEGYLYVVDRLKDMIISGGENIYPAEIESVLLEHPGISNAAVIGRPDEKWGEHACAVVVLKPGVTLTLDELRSFCQSRLASYKIPKEMKVLEELPLSGVGKVLKKVLRQILE